MHINQSQIATRAVWSIMDQCNVALGFWGILELSGAMGHGIPWHGTVYTEGWEKVWVSRPLDGAMYHSARRPDHLATHMDRNSCPRLE